MVLVHISMFCLRKEVSHDSPSARPAFVRSGDSPSARFRCVRFGLGGFGELFVPRSADELATDGRPASSMSQWTRTTGCKTSRQNLIILNGL